MDNEWISEEIGISLQKVDFFPFPDTLDKRFIRLINRVYVKENIPAKKPKALSSPWIFEKNEY